MSASIITRSVLIILALSIGAYFLLSARTVIRVVHGQQRQVNLPDGTEVRLNSGSVFSYSKWDWIWSRRVELEEGEAFFIVEKGKKLQVITAEGMVTMPGTRFNVHMRNKRLQVSCYDGKLSVNYGADEQVLTPGQSFIFANGEIVDGESAGITAQPSWVKGITRLRKVPFRELLESLERTFAIEVIQQDSALDSLVYSGSFPNDPEVAFKLALRPMKVAYEFEANKKQLIILGKSE